MALAVRQVVTGFAGAGVTTVSADFTDGASGGIGVALASSAIVFVVAGDKNSGTFTPPSSAATVPVDLRTADVSLMMAWGTAAGGESVVSGTIGANIAGAQVWLIELTDSAMLGAWSVVASATHNSDGTTVTVWSTGTTGAASADGLAIAAVGADSVNTAGTPSWSNSFTDRRTTSSGGGQAGLWGSTKAISSGATAETTLTRTGGTADQHSGAILVFSRAAGTDSAALAGSSPHPTGTLLAVEILPTVLAGSAPLATGALAAVEILPTVLAGSSPHPVGALTAVEGVPAVLAGSAPLAIGALAGAVRHTGVLAGSAPLATGALAGAVRNVGALAGAAPQAFGNMFGGTDFGVLAGSAPRAVGRLRTVHHPLVATGSAVMAGGPAADGTAELGTGPLAAGAGTDPVAELGTGPAASGAVVLG